MSSSVLKFPRKLLWRPILTSKSLKISKNFFPPKQFMIPLVYFDVRNLPFSKNSLGKYRMEKSEKANIRN